MYINLKKYIMWMKKKGFIVCCNNHVYAKKRKCIISVYTFDKIGLIIYLTIISEFAALMVYSNL